MEIDDEDFAPVEVADTNALASISQLVNKLLDMEAHIDALDGALKAAKRDYDAIEKELIENLLSAGTQSHTTLTGTKVEIKNALLVTEIKDPVKKAELMHRRAQWLEENEGASMIREAIELSFEKGDHARAIEVMSALDSLGARYVNTETINAGTFKSFVNTMLESGDKVPLDELGLYQKTEAKITLPRKRK